MMNYSRMTDERLTTIARTAGELLNALTELPDDEEAKCFIEVVSDLLNDAILEIEVRWGVDGHDDPGAVAVDAPEETETFLTLGQCKICHQWTISGEICAECRDASVGI